MHAERHRRSSGSFGGHHPPHALDDPGVRRRGRPRRESTEQAIVQAVLELVVRVGVSGVTIEAVAARAKVAKTTVYRRWSTKADMILDAVSSIKGTVVVPPPGGTVRDDLIHVLNALRVNAEQTIAGQLMAKICAELRNDPVLGDMYWERLIRPQRTVVVGILERGVREGIVDPGLDLDLITEMLAAPLVLRRALWPRPLPDASVELIVDVVLSGSAPRPGVGQDSVHDDAGTAPPWRE